MSDPTRTDVLTAALTVARHFDEDAFACDFAGQTSINMPSLDTVIPILALRPAPAPETSGLREAAQAFVDAWDAPAMSTDDLFGIVSAVVPALRAALATERP